MKREELEELHYIAPISNVPSMLELGILSHNRAKNVEHESVAMQVIQDRRAKVVVPGGRRLHDYVNLYIHARNPMMYVRRSKHLSLCVLSIRTDVLHSPRVVVTDRNAAGDYVRFAAAPEGLAIVDRDLAFATYWADPDPVIYLRKKSARCAEVLVPNRVDPSFIVGAYVSRQETHDTLHDLLAERNTQLDSIVDGDLFFR